jgi:mono/diheme cytochrome c family protein
MNRFKIMIIALLTAAVAVACSSATNVTHTSNNNAGTSANVAGTPQAPATNALSNSTAAVSGKEIYATNCMICHKDDGKGGKVTVEGKNLKVDDLTTEKMQKRDDAKLAKEILEGVPDEGMPSFQGKLTDEEVRSIVQHIRSLQKPL